MGCEKVEQDKFSHYSTRYEINNYSFAVKDSKGEPVGPRGNIFSDDTRVVFSDDDGIHLRLSRIEDTLLAAEIISVDAKGFGRYEFVLEGNVDQIPAQVVVSPFLYADDENEVDIEFSSWSKEDNLLDSPWLGRGNYQFIFQPYDQIGNSLRPNELLTLKRESGRVITSYRIDNLRNKVKIEMYEGKFSEGNLISKWEYPRGVIKGDEMNFRLNVYIRNWSNIEKVETKLPIEIILKDFQFKKVYSFLDFFKRWVE